MITRPIRPLGAADFGQPGSLAEDPGGTAAPISRFRGLGAQAPAESRTTRVGMGLAARLLLACAACMSTIGRVEAAPYYTATAIGNFNDFRQDSQGLTNTQTGVFYAFATTTTPITDADLQNLPSGTVLQGVTNLQLMPYTMHVTAINSSGTIIGSIPTNGGSNPWNNPTLGYAVRFPDGQYSGFVSLITLSGSDQQASTLHLSQANQILVDSYVVGTGERASLVDIKSGVTTPLGQLIPPALLQQFPSGFHPDAIDDRGDILVDTVFGPQGAQAYILTPAGLAAPTATPEPSSLLICGLIAGAAGLRSVIHRSRDRSAS